MDPNRKRRLRLFVALGVAVLLAGALVYTSFSAASDAKDPSQLAASAVAGRSYQLTGKVVPGYRRDGNALFFRVRDRHGTASVAVRYIGAVPDPFRAGREVIVNVRKQGTVFAGEKDSLVTKCPSKFSAKSSGHAT
ncbi:MAG TPA: cytochrome c maturation protein CcmE [Solirubrobacteraceae bacterium]|jgi:cytochrome c-type biogenesis protein CcmE|nr:cytochrome c maturation protein CcmE [Solirubrobacteraceae bacterium]